MIGHTTMPAGARSGLEPIDQVDDVEERAARAGTDTTARDRNGEMRFASPGAANQHDIALVSQKIAIEKIVNQRLVDRRAVEGEVADILGQRQSGERDLILDRAGLLLGNLGSQQIADDLLRFVLALHRRGDDLVERRLHAVELQLGHGGEDLGTLHHTALLSLSYRSQSAAGACRSRRASGVMIVIGGAGSRRRARMLMTTSAEWTPSRSASRQAASTAGSPSLSTAVRMPTIWRSPSAAPASLRRIRSRPAGSTQSLNGAPFLSAPGLRARTGT